MSNKEIICTAFWLAILLSIIKGIASGVWGYFHQPADIIHTDTVTIVRIDTMYVDRPTEVVRYVTRYDTIKEKDLIVIHDTTGEPAIVLPIEQTVYHDSSGQATYDAYVSGYHAALDSIRIYSRNTETVITKIEREKTGRLGAGIQLGVGVSAQGIAAPYIGIGIQYRLFGN